MGSMSVSALSNAWPPEQLQLSPEGLKAAVKWRVQLWGQHSIHPVPDHNGGFVDTAACL